MTSSVRRACERDIDWIATSVEVAQGFGDGHAEATDDYDDAQRVVSAVARHCCADLVTLVEPTADGMLRIVAAAGAEADAWRGVRAPADGSLSAPLFTGAGPRRIARVTDRLDPQSNVTPITGIGDVLLLPVPGSHGTVRAVLTIGRSADGPPFADTDLVPAAMLAAQVGAALCLRAETARAHRRILADERDRIAQVMQAQVVQRLFRLGLTLQAAAAEADDRPAHVLQAGSDEIDETVKAIRATIYRVGG